MLRKRNMLLRVLEPLLSISLHLGGAHPTCGLHVHVLCHGHAVLRFMLCATFLPRLVEHVVHRASCSPPSANRPCVQLPPSHSRDEGQGEPAAAILSSLQERNLLTPPLAGAIAAADTLTKLEDLYLRRSDGALTLLADVADVRVSKTPNNINRENGARRIVVQHNVEGRPLSEVVADVERALEPVRRRLGTA